MSKNEHEKYEGQGHVVSALGKSTAYGLAAMPVTFGLGFAGASQVVKGNVGNAVALHGASMIVGTAATLGGLVAGWKQATRAQTQHDALAGEVQGFTKREELRREVSDAVGRGK